MPPSSQRPQQDVRWPWHVLLTLAVCLLGSSPAHAWPRWLRDENLPALLRLDPKALAGPRLGHPPLKPLDPVYFNSIGGPRREVICFDLDGTLTGNSIADFRAAVRLDSWLASHSGVISPVIITGGTKEEAEEKLALWGYRRNKNNFYLSTCGGTQLWGWDGKEISIWRDHIDERWNRQDVLTPLTRIAEGNGAMSLFRPDMQLDHRVGLYVDRMKLPQSLAELPVAELGRLLVAGPLDDAGIEVVEVEGETPATHRFTKPHKALAARVVPYVYPEEQGRLVSFSVMPYRAGKLEAVRFLEGRVIIGDEANDPLEAADLLSREQLRWHGGKRSVVDEIFAVALPSKAMKKRIHAFWDGREAAYHAEGSDKPFTTRIYLARKRGPAGALEGLQVHFKRLSVDPWEDRTIRREDLNFIRKNGGRWLIDFWHPKARQRRKTH